VQQPSAACARRRWLGWRKRYMVVVWESGTVCLRGASRPHHTIWAVMRAGECGSSGILTADSWASDGAWGFSAGLTPADGRPPNGCTGCEIGAAPRPISSWAIRSGLIDRRQCDTLVRPSLGVACVLPRLGNIRNILQIPRPSEFSAAVSRHCRGDSETCGEYPYCSRYRAIGQR